MEIVQVGDCVPQFLGVSPRTVNCLGPKSDLEPIKDLPLLGRLPLILPTENLPVPKLLGPLVPHRSNLRVLFSLQVVQNFAQNVSGGFETVDLPRRVSSKQTNIGFHIANLSRRNL